MTALLRLSPVLLLALALACKDKAPDPAAPRVHGAQPAQAAPGDKPAVVGPALSVPPAPNTPRVRQEKCVDRWLAEQKLNPYGDPPDTTYAGGNPLFDEATGQAKDRLEHVFQKHPEARTRCETEKQ